MSREPEDTVEMTEEDILDPSLLMSPPPRDPMLESFLSRHNISTESEIRENMQGVQNNHPQSTIYHNVPSTTYSNNAHGMETFSSQSNNQTETLIHNNAASTSSQVYNTSSYNTEELPLQGNNQLQSLDTNAASNSYSSSSDFYSEAGSSSQDFSQAETMIHNNVTAANYTGSFPPQSDNQLPSFIDLDAPSTSYSNGTHAMELTSSQGHNVEAFKNNVASSTSQNNYILKELLTQGNNQKQSFIDHSAPSTSYANNMDYQEGYLPNDNNQTQTFPHNSASSTNYSYSMNGTTASSSQGHNLETFTSTNVGLSQNKYILETLAQQRNNQSQSFPHHSGPSTSHSYNMNGNASSSQGHNQVVTVPPQSNNISQQGNSQSQSFQHHSPSTSHSYNMNGNASSSQGHNQVGTFPSQGNDQWTSSNSTVNSVQAPDSYYPSQYPYIHGVNVRTLSPSTSTSQSANQEISLSFVPPTHKALFICKYCNENFGTRWTLSIHQLTHTGDKPYKCNRCGDQFQTASYLKHHQSIHREEPPDQCPECSQKFRKGCHSYVHVRTHDGDKHHKCCICGKDVQPSELLDDHMLTHDKEKPFKCTQCFESFKHKEHLSSHLRLHQGEKPLNCTRCNASFHRKSSLRNHMRIHKETDVPVSCPICNQRFMNQPTFEVHFKTHKDDDDKKCE